MGIISLHYKVPQKALVKLGIIANKSLGTYTSYEIRNGLFYMYNKAYTYKIVMLGDSITAGVEWNELLGLDYIANRGISGDTTKGFIDRLQTIYDLHPALCFIMGGINDIYGEIPLETIIKNMEIVIEEIRNHDITLIMQSTLYVAKSKTNSKKTNDKVNQLNTWLGNYCREKDIIFIDINKTLETDGALDEQYTYDGVHLLGNAYAKWRDLLLPIIIAKL